jgi:hypothetical protein
LVQRLQTISSLGNAKALLSQSVSDSLEDELVVVNDEDFLQHAMPLARIGIQIR